MSDCGAANFLLKLLNDFPRMDKLLGGNGKLFCR